MRVISVAALCAAIATCANVGTGFSLSDQQKPKLIVQLVVDQMRADYPARYGSQWTEGLRRLFTEGAYFTEARFPYAATVTCAGHASIGTGTVPSVHGMARNEWWDREQRRRIHCPDDPLVSPVGFTKAVRGRYSGRRLLAETFAERLDASQPPDVGRVVSFSLKPRSAIGLAGRRGDAVVWFDPDGSFASSSAYPMPEWLTSHLRSRPIEQMLDAEWMRARPVSAYIGDDEDAGATPPRGWSDRFPHKLSDTARPDLVFYDRWQRSPFSDAYLVDMAIAAVDALSLGQGAGVDYLGVSFSALDLVGHKFGPDSHEVQDVLIRLDAAIGRLLAHLDAKIGADRYVLGLTSDHGVGDVPEETGRGGRLPRGTMAKIVEGILDEAWGDEPHVVDEIYTDIYLDEAARTRLAADEAAQTRIKTALQALPAVRRIIGTADLESVRTSKDPVLQAVLLSYYPDRSGDFMILLREHFTTSTDAASHGTPYEYDRHVPVVLFGKPFRAGKFAEPASPLDIAATWSRLTGVALDRPYGRTLAAAVK